MAQVRKEKIQPVVVEHKYVLELSEDEAVDITAVLGLVAGNRNSHTTDAFLKLSASVPPRYRSVYEKLEINPNAGSISFGK